MESAGRTPDARPEAQRPCAFVAGLPPLRWLAPDPLEGRPVRDLGPRPGPGPPPPVAGRWTDGDRRDLEPRRAPARPGAAKRGRRAVVCSGRGRRTSVR